MRAIAVFFLVFVSTHAFADVFNLGDQNYKCETTGGFFDFSPAGAIATCREEIAEFCKSKGSPPVVKKEVGEPSGYGRYARAEITFQCASEEDVARKEEAKYQQARKEIENSKRLCENAFGFKPGTIDFSNCLLELQKQNFQSKRSAEALAAQNEQAEAELRQRRQAATERSAIEAQKAITNSLKPAVPAGGSISCTSNRLGTTTFTNCN